MTNLEIKPIEAIEVEVDKMLVESKKQAKIKQNSVDKRGVGFIKELMLRKYQTIQECADIIGIDRSDLSKILNGRTEPTIKQKIEITKALGFDDSSEIFE